MGIMFVWKNYEIYVRFGIFDFCVCFLNYAKNLAQPRRDADAEFGEIFPFISRIVLLSSRTSENTTREFNTCLSHIFDRGFPNL